jgi:hypothetical protein
MPNWRSVSTKKIEANRKNAQKSTGPKTLQGKKQSSTNAIKDGLFVKHLANLPLENEDAKEFEKLYLDLVVVHQPVGRAEIPLVEKMAICLLRSARAWRYENAELYRHHRWEGDAEKAAVQRRHDIAEQMVENRGVTMKRPIHCWRTSPWRNPSTSASCPWRSWG